MKLDVQITDEFWLDVGTVMGEDGRFLILPPGSLSERAVFRDGKCQFKPRRARRIRSFKGFLGVLGGLRGKKCFRMEFSDSC
jgi:hypothetical protein